MWHELFFVCLPNDSAEKNFCSQFLHWNFKLLNCAASRWPLHFWCRIKFDLLLNTRRHLKHLNTSVLAGTKLSLVSTPFWLLNSLQWRWCSDSRLGYANSRVHTQIYLPLSFDGARVFASLRTLIKSPSSFLCSCNLWSLSALSVQKEALQVQQ